jgi:type I restriction enzyme S subunit
MSGFPSGWISKQLSSVVKPRKQKAAPSSLGSIPFVGLEHVEAHSARILGHGCTSEMKSAVAVFEAGDVLYGRLRPYLNKVVRPDFPGAASAEFIVLPGNEQIDAAFLHRLLMQPAFVEFASHINQGDRPRVDFEQIGEFLVGLPPISEQRRIIAKLDSLLKRSKGAHEDLTHIPRLVERYKEAILRLAFRGELTREWRTRRAGKIERAAAMVARTLVPTQPRGGREAAERVIRGITALSVNNPGTPAPEGWSWVPLTRIARQETGHTPSRSHPEWWGGDVPWIGIKDAHVHHGTVITDTLQTTNAEGLAHSAARILPAGTVCLSRTASVGYVLIMGRPMATSQDFVTWSCTEALLPKFLMYAMMADALEKVRRIRLSTFLKCVRFTYVLRRLKNSG